MLGPVVPVAAAPVDAVDAVDAVAVVGAWDGAVLRGSPDVDGCDPEAEGEDPHPASTVIASATTHTLLRFETTAAEHARRCGRRGVRATPCSATRSAAREGDLHRRRGRRRQRATLVDGDDTGVGGVTGAALGADDAATWKDRYGISDDFVKQVGGMVQPAQLLFKPDPVYPAALQAAGIEGTVLIEAVISKDGLPLTLKVRNTSDPAFVSAAMDSARQYRWSPTTLNGEPIEALATMQIDFKLQSR